MFGNKPVSKPIQYELDLRFPRWIQLELDLEYPPPPEKPSYEELFGSLCVQNNPLYSDYAITSGPLRAAQWKFQLGEDCKSRIHLTPEFYIDVPYEMPNRLVRFFHKILFNAIWETL